MSAAFGGELQNDAVAGSKIDDGVFWGDAGEVEARFCPLATSGYVGGAEKYGEEKADGDDCEANGDDSGPDGHWLDYIMTENANN